MTPHHAPGFRWQPNIGVLVFVVIFVPVTISLGFWQLHRAAEKEVILRENHARQAANPEPLSRLDTGQNHQYRRVYVKGQFQNEITVLLDNRVRHGRPGYEVVTLFSPTDDSADVWVNRGWIEGSLHRSRVPDVPMIAGEHQIRGYLYQPLSEPFTVGAETVADDWPQVFQNLDRELLAELLGKSFFPYTLRLDRDSAGALETGWDIVNVLPEKHTGYAVQWFTMAGALIILALFANSNLGQVLKDKRRRQPPEKHR